MTALHIIAAGAAFYALCSLLLAVLAVRAPEGFEDSAGFHRGLQSGDDLGGERTNPLAFSPASSLHESPFTAARAGRSSGMSNNISRNTGKAA